MPTPKKSPERKEAMQAEMRIKWMRIRWQERYPLRKIERKYQTRKARASMYYIVGNLNGAVIPPKPVSEECERMLELLEAREQLQREMEREKRWARKFEVE